MFSEHCSALIADCDNREIYFSFIFQTSPSLQAWKVTPNIFYETEIHTPVANVVFSTISLFFLLLSIFSCVTMKMVDIGLKVLDFQSSSGNKWRGESVAKLLVGIAF